MIELIRLYRIGAVAAALPVCLVLAGCASERVLFRQ